MDTATKSIHLAHDNHPVNMVRKRTSAWSKLQKQNLLKARMDQAKLDRHLRRPLKTEKEFLALYSKQTKGRKRRGAKRTTRARTQQIGGFLPGLLGHLIGNHIRKKQGKKPVKFDTKEYMQNAIGGRIKVAKTVAGKKAPTPGNTGMSGTHFMKSGLLGIG